MKQRNEAEAELGEENGGRGKTAQEDNVNN